MLSEAEILLLLSHCFASKQTEDVNSCPAISEMFVVFHQFLTNECPHNRCTLFIVYSPLMSVKFFYVSFAFYLVYHC